ncbi:hypothetical protein M9H77_11124 [Catharanthus roseus]|uniref:Uncharacterized protein n=1 Tax=Catharanthus roseus TaxID=4058 RepID=A0ACC0BDL1_CATRO|nr:hypothetical protein M9H77_11124 [Catharanthus roseus]
MNTVTVISECVLKKVAYLLKDKSAFQTTTLFILAGTRKQIREGKAFSWFPNLLFLKIVLSRLDVGPAYYEDPVSSNPTYIKGIKAFLSGGAIELTLLLQRERAFPFSAVLPSEVIVLASSVDNMAALQLTQEWDRSGPPPSSLCTKT